MLLILASTGASFGGLETSISFVAFASADFVAESNFRVSANWTLNRLHKFSNRLFSSAKVLSSPFKDCKYIF